MFVEKVAADDAVVRATRKVGSSFFISRIGEIFLRIETLMIISTRFALTQRRMITNSFTRPDMSESISVSIS